MTATGGHRPTEDQMMAAVEAGHEMDGLVLTGADRAAALRVLRGETTAEQEAAAMLAQLRGTADTRHAREETSTMTAMTLSPDVAVLGWVRAYPDLFGQLDDRQARALHNAIANNVLEGYQPARADIADQVDVILGRITGDELTARVLARTPPSGA